MTLVSVHATCVAWHRRGLLILGPSGAGKSGLALQLMALGATLVSDDRTELWAEGTTLTARAPETLHGLIEARGIGILRAPALPRADVVLVVDLGQTETDRLPPERHVTLLGLERPLVLGSTGPHFSASVLCYLQNARVA